MEGTIRIRELQESDISMVVGWATDEQWPISENQFRAWVAFDPHGFKVAENSEGKIIGCIGGCKLTETLASGGCFIVAKELRKCGVGRLLWEARLHYLGDACNLSIAAMEARVESNIKKGFTHLSYHIYNYSGIPNRQVLSKTNTDHFQVIPYNDAMLDDVSNYDMRIHTVARREFLNLWISPTDSNSFVAKNSKGDIVGYCAIKPCTVGYQLVAPVYADNDEIAEVLFNTLIHSVPEGSTIAVDIPSTNKLLSQLASNCGLHQHFHLIRMYNKQELVLPVIEKVYAIASAGISLI